MKKSLLILCLFSIAVLARAEVTVRKSGADKTSIDLSSFGADGAQDSQLFRKVLETDLMRSGWFTRAASGGGQYNIQGSASAGLSVQCRVVDRGTAQTRLGKSYSSDSAGARRLAHKVADDIVEAITGQRGIASGRLAIVGNRSGHKEVYVCDADGDGLAQLTRDNSISLSPNWGPGGRQLLYTSFMKRNPYTYLVTPASGERRVFASYPGLNTGAVFSPDGRDVALVLSKDGNPELYLKSVGSGELTRLTRTPKAAEASPSFSPDGRQIVYVSDQVGVGRPQIYVIDRSGGSPRLLPGRSAQNVAPEWGPKGLIAYASLVGGGFQIRVINPATGESEQVSQGGGSWEDPTWAPDGRHIVCARTVNYQSKLYLLDILGDPPIALAEFQGDWYSPSWAR